MRLHVAFALLTALLLFLTFRGGKAARFSFADVQTLAERLSHEAYQPRPDRLPPQLRKLTPAQELGIFWNDTYRLWRKKGLPFQVDFFPLSNDVHVPVAINTVDRHGANRLAYSPSFFHFNTPVSPPLPPDLGYGGFYIRYPHMAPKSDPKSPLDGFFSVEGASYFRVLGKQQVYGLSARGLAVNAIVENKEEFPQFTEWWLHQPGANDSSMIVDALLDSPSVAGAYEFTLHPGAQTSVDVHATLYFRKTVAQLGLAPFSSMYFYGENAPNHFGNYHPEIHDSDGVLLNNGRGEWVWRPLEQASFRQVYNFLDENPRGFGLVQRDRDFQHYQDLGMAYNLRPSAWVTPHGQWGKGALQLIQLVTNNTNTDNAVLQWHPDVPPQAGERMDLNYTVDFYMNDANRPPLAYATQTLVNNPAPPPPTAPMLMGPPVPANLVAKLKPPAPGSPTAVQFLVDFAGNGIENIAPDRRPDIDLSCTPPTARIRESAVQKNDYDKSWRVTFTVVPAKVNVPVDIRCSLRQKNRPLSETWTYTWNTPAPGK